MSSERRHQLEHNELAAWLAKVNKSIEPYSKLIAILVSVGIVALIGWSFMSTESLAKRSDATLQLIQAAAGGDAEILMQVSDTYPDTQAGNWARLYQGQQLLSQGIQALFRDRDQAEILLTDAQQALKSAVSSSNETLLVSRGHYGIAQACEALGDVDGAKTSYEQVVKVNESEAMVKRAEERIAALEKPQTQDFLAWFGEQDFSPPDPSLPPTLPGGNTLPEMPDLSLPTLDLGGDSSTATPEGGLELPVGTTEAASEEASTETEPATESEPATSDAAAESTSGDGSAESQPATEDVPAESAE
jgi:hypothetical protein